MDATHQPGGRAGSRWPAPAATAPVQASLALPGSKSMTNRALVLAALADGPGTIINPLAARDTLLMARALAALGATIEGPATPALPPGGATAGPATAGPATAGPAVSGLPAVWHVTPGRPHGDTSVDVGNAGTVMRFVPPVATLTPVAVEFHGDAQASRRPVGPVLTALRELGAVIDDGGRGSVPFTVRGSGSLAGGAVSLDASASSQFISGLLLAAPRFGKGVEVRHHGPRLPSAPHIAMTVQMLRDAGVTVETGGREPAPPAGSSPDAAAGPATGGTWRVLPGPIRAGTVTVQPDVVNATPFLAAALVTGGSVTIRGWPWQTSQPAGQLLDLLTRMGGERTARADGLTVTGTGTVHGIAADMGDVSELVPVLTAAAALASSPSRLTGVAHMRRHETDRLAALATEINALGGDVTQLPDGLLIRPRPLHAGVIASYDDHRMVMAAAVLGLAVPGIEIENAATVGKTFPEFPSLWSAMLAGPP